MFVRDVGMGCCFSAIWKEFVCELGDRSFLNDCCGIPSEQGVFYFYRFIDKEEYSR